MKAMKTKIVFYLSPMPDPDKIKGMPVLDSEGEKIGEIVSVHPDYPNKVFAEVDPDAFEQGTHFPQDVSIGFKPEN